MEPSAVNWLPSLHVSNARRWQRALEGMDADLVSRDPVGLILQARSAVDCPAPWLPYLAAERSVNEFSSAWPETSQRAVTADSFRFHQVQGTRPALDRALAPLGYSVKVVEWFERDLRAPYTFRLVVELGAEPWTAAQRAELLRVAIGAKNLHTHLETLEYRRKLVPASVYVGGTVRIRRALRIRQEPRAVALRSRANVFVGAIVKIRRTLRIKPRP